jgi:hypothetical protein
MPARLNLMVPGCACVAVCGGVWRRVAARGLLVWHVLRLVRSTRYRTCTRC